MTMRDTPHPQIEPRSETERAYALLRAELLGGALAPGERLRPGDLQARLDVGLGAQSVESRREGVECRSFIPKLVIIFSPLLK